MWDIGDSVTVLARYGAPVTQRTLKGEGHLGSCASVTQDHGKGKIVIFGPHPDGQASWTNVRTVSITFRRRLLNRILSRARQRVIELHRF